MIDVSAINLWFVRLRFRGERQQFWRDAAAMLRANRSLLNWLRSLHIAEPRSSQGAAAGVVAARMATVPEFASAIGPLLPALDRLMVQAADVARDKARIYDLLAEQIEMSQKLRALLVGALTLPLIALGASIFTVYIYGSQVFPQFASVIPLNRWTGHGRFVAELAIAAAGPPGLIAAGLLIALAVGVALSFDRLTGPVRRFLDDHIPPYTLVRNVRGVEVTMALATLLESKQGVQQILERMHSLGSPWLSWHAMQIGDLTRSRHAADPLAALNTGLLSRSLYFRLRQYSEVAGSELSSLMLQAARDEGARLQRRLVANSTRLGLVVYLIAASIFVLLWTSIPQVSPAQFQTF